MSKTIFLNRRLSVPLRLKLLDDLVLPISFSNIFYGSGSWPLLSARQFQSLASTITKWQRRIAGKGFWKEDNITDAEFRARWRIPPLAVCLAKHRLLFLLQLHRCGPQVVWDSISVFNSISDIPSVSQLDVIGGFRNIWIPWLSRNELKCLQFIEDSIDFLVLKCTDLNLKLSPLDGVGSIAGSGLFGRLNGTKKGFQKIFLKNFVIVFSPTSLQQRLHGSLSPHMIWRGPGVKSWKSTRLMQSATLKRFGLLLYGVEHRCMMSSSKLCKLRRSITSSI